ncbi:hypothetical protein [Cupriavidus sp.]|uniref:hypothetical protein n=1 Tax=Cupriavidus sp. TaxID=1873897 RepID=UPI003D0B9014
MPKRHSVDTTYPPNLHELVRLAQEATPGPWKSDIQVGDESHCYANVYPARHVRGGYNGVIAGQKSNRRNSQADQRAKNIRYIAAANPATTLCLVACIENLLIELVRVEQIASTLKQRAETFPVTVIVKTLEENGRKTESDFVARFKLCDRGELQRLRDCAPRKVMQEVVSGWSGVLDADGQEMPFNHDNLGIMLNIPPVLAGLTEAFWENVIDHLLRRRTHR